MTSSDIVIIVVALVSSTLAWLLADAASKARSESVAQRAAINETKVDRHEIELAKSQQDRVELHSAIDRLEATKESKEMAEANNRTLDRFMVEINRRFDKLEAIVENHSQRQ